MDANAFVGAGEELRTSRRLYVDCDGFVREAGASLFAVRVKDLSQDGCRFTSECAFETATTVWLKMPGVTPRQARIVWRRGSEYGCEFLEPLGTESTHELRRLRAAARGAA